MKAISGNKGRCMPRFFIFRKLPCQCQSEYNSIEYALRHKISGALFYFLQL